MHVGKMGSTPWMVVRLTLAMESVGHAYMTPRVYDKSKSLGRPTTYKEGGSSMKFELFNGALDKLKALTFLQQFDMAYRGSFTEDFKIHKATTMLKDNAQQWRASILNDANQPTTGEEFKRVFSIPCLTLNFVVKLIVEWRNLNATHYTD